MSRYVVVSWNGSSAIQRDVAQRLGHRLLASDRAWGCVLDLEGLRVYTCSAGSASGTSLVFSDGTGIVLGTLFEGAVGLTVRRKLSLVASECDAIRVSRGRSLAQRYWGTYIAIVYDPATQRTIVLRDPTGRLACMRLTYHNVHLFCSDIEDIARLQVLAVSFNWKRIALGLVECLLENDETALQGVTNVMPGQCIEVQHGILSKHLYWRSSEFARSESLVDPERASSALLATVKMCVDAWASCHSNIVLHLSGGLDSSILAGCLLDSPTHPHVIAVNEYSEGSDSDERLFAQIAAKHAGCELIERLRNPQVDFSVLLDEPRTAVPRHYLPLLIARRDPEQTLARDHNCTAIFDGHGGDGLFYQNPLEAVVADHVFDRGYRPAVFRTALDTARATDRSVWSVLRENLRPRALARRWNPIAEASEFNTLLSRDTIHALTDGQRFAHPWFEHRHDIPPGKLWHMLPMALPMNFDDIGARGAMPELVTPLVSQPLYELCLTIPTYVLAGNGWDRGLARLSFTHEVPRVILRRRSKGGIEEYVQEMLARNKPFIRRLLIDGQLAREHLIDRRRVEEVLSDGPTAIPTRPVELLTLIAAESWLQTWSLNQRQAVA